MRDAREKLGLTLEEVERGTHIRAHYLDAMERGDFNFLPSTVQARGFLRNYAEYLGLDRDVILLQFAGLIQSRGAGPPTGPAKRSAGSYPGQAALGRKRWFSSDLAVTAALVIFIIAMVAWGGARVLGALRVPDETLHQAAALIQPTATATIALSTPVFVPDGSGENSIQEEAPRATQPNLLGLVDSIYIRIVAEQRALVSVQVDGVEVFNARMAPGDIQEFRGDEAVEIRASNAGGIRVFYNDQDQGPLGVIDEPITRVWTLEGLTTPTPTVSPTPTITPTPTVTPIASATPASPRVLPGQ
ncbi:MAG: DUF4115 domain-containing protein [Anaerolineales bacterium]|nr:DUF4115 domain-containing protein [Anaerolineales bacterium]